MTNESIDDLIEQLEEEREHLRLVLEQVPEHAITQRPSIGAWSGLENVRHLLFAEQLHLGRSLHGSVEWSPLGYSQPEMREVRKLPPADPNAPTLEAVLAAWDEFHPTTIARLAGVAPDVIERALRRNLTHLRAHSRVIERLARNASD